VIAATAKQHRGQRPLLKLASVGLSPALTKLIGE
jgi:hypothetical protein